MPDELPYDKMLQESLKGELKVLNAHLPSESKTLSALLAEDTPAVACSDGSAHLFKRKELQYLAGILEPAEQETLQLPIMIEVDPGKDEISVMCRGDAEEKVISKLLEMPLNIKGNRIKIFKPQLAVIRKKLKTTTQYLFSPKVLQ
jgi:uncharacterized protein (UPF0216 family)